MKIWTEKYRPAELKDISGQEHVIDRIKYFIEKGNLPHCLFAGPAGIGKTSTSICIANELFGGNWKRNFLELNASDERGIDTIRVKVKDFARTIPMGTKFKIIYLDEADSLTKDAQHALRRTMEKYSDTARFILAVNYSSKIIDPIQSRTAIFHFKPLEEEKIKKRLISIAEKEKLDLNEEAINAINNIADGDMRRAINIMQTAAISGEKITEDIIYSVTSQADPQSVKNILDLCLNKKFSKAREKLLELQRIKGASGEDIIKEIHKQLLKTDLDNQKLSKIMENVGNCEFRITEGSDPRIQLEALLAKICYMDDSD